MDYKNQPILKISEEDLKNLTGERTPSTLENLVILSMAFGGAVGGTVLAQITGNEPFYKAAHYLQEGINYISNFF